MTTHQNGHSKSLIDQFIELLDSEGIDYAISESGNALMIYGETVAGTCEGFIVVEELEATDLEDEDAPAILLDFCEIAYVLPLENIPSERHGALFELLIRLNESHRIGGYELHIEEHELRFRIYLTLPAKQHLDREHLLMPLYEGVRAINAHWEAFDLVLNQGCDPAHGIGEIYAREALTEGFSEELLERANVMFELAQTRYERRGDADQIVKLDERLKRLAVETGAVMARHMS